MDRTPTVLDWSVTTKCQIPYRSIKAAASKMVSLVSATAASEASLVSETVEALPTRDRRGSAT